MGRKKQNNSKKVNAGIALDMDLILYLNLTAAKNNLSKSQLAEIIFRKFLGLKLSPDQEKLRIKLD